jgi:hypothetical protein
MSSLDRSYPHAHRIQVQNDRLGRIGATREREDIREH